MGLNELREPRLTFSKSFAGKGGCPDLPDYLIGGRGDLRQNESAVAVMSFGVLARPGIPYHNKSVAA